MQSRLFPALGLGVAMLISTPAQAGDSAAATGAMMAGSAMHGAHPGGMGHPGGMVRPGGSVHRWGGLHNGRWYAGWRAPGGWGAYRRPVVGWTLPGYWMQPSFYIPSWSTYGFYAPQAGYGWSRYYDDAVLTDRYGRVIDTRSGVRWDRYEGGYDPDWRDDYAYDDYGPAPVARRDDGVGGALIGGAVGALAGNRIAGRGNRTAGTLVGAAVGAVAGAAIDKAEDAPRGRPLPPPPARRVPPPPGYDVDYRDNGVTYNNEYSGRWTGTWHGDDGRTYSGEYDGTYRGSVPAPHDRPPHWAGGPGVGYPAPPPHHGYGAPGSTTVVTSGGGGYIANGFYYPAPVVTTIIMPTTTTTTTTVTEEVVTYSRAKRRVARPRRTVTCSCR